MTHITKRRQFLLGASLTMANAAFAQTVRLNNKQRPRIYMVTWRGKTDAEKGFVDFWKTQKNN